MEDKGSAVTEACKAKKALTYIHHFLSDISAFYGAHWKDYCVKIDPEKDLKKM
jgi:hypothetical protein